MDYSLQKELHEKALSILELREKAVKRLRTVEDNLYKYERMDKMQKMYCFYNLSDYTWEVKKWTRGVSFIEGVYERHMWKMRDTIPWKSAMLLPGKGIIGNLDLIPEIDYWVPKGTTEKGGYFGMDLELKQRVDSAIPGLVEDYIERKENEPELPKLNVIFHGKETGNVFVRDDQDISHPTMFLTPRLNEELQRRSKEMFEQQNTEKGLVEPVGVSYEETYSPRSTGYQ